MRHPHAPRAGAGLHLALAACVAITGSVGHAAPPRRGAKVVKQAAKPKPVVEPEPEADPDEAEADTGVARLAARARHRRPGDVDRVAFASRDDGDAVEPVDQVDIVEVDTPAKLHRLAAPPAKAWHVAIGPYLWASSVDANVSLGPTSIGSGVDFIQLEHHAKYGAEVLGEAHYGRFSVSGDFMYGVVAVDGGTSVGPLMVTLSGEASSLLVDGAAGYQLLGDDRSLLAVEARAGVRYQRTSVAGSLGVSGSAVTPPEQIDAGADAIAGGHVVVRPFRRLFASSTFDVGVFGASRTTWSLAADASVQVTSHVLLSLGWRTLTMDRAHVDIVMHGPRAALQVTF